MKKLLLALMVLGGLVADASARYCGSSCGTRSCAPACEVVEEPCGQPPCCLTAVQVPARKKTFIRHEWVCPIGCTESGAGTVLE